MMMPMETRNPISINGKIASAVAAGGGDKEWEVRPGGMLVQKRDPNDEQTRIPPPQLLKLNGIMAEGDVKLQRKLQVKRVQKYVETLDVLKVKNSVEGSNGNENLVQKQQPPSVQVNHVQSYSNGHGGVTGRNVPHNQTKQAPFPKSRRSVGNFVPIPLLPKQQQEPSRISASSSSGEVVVTTQWETFDSMPTAAPPQSSTTNTVNHPKFSWDLL